MSYLLERRSIHSRILNIAGRPTSKWSYYSKTINDDDRNVSQELQHFPEGILMCEWTFHIVYCENMITTSE